ncbi:SRPBCC family protein [Deinococcus piscis]|nr:SRPBCC family protein [Deinococcus piscis]
MKIPTLPTAAFGWTVATQERAFAETVPVELSTIFTGWGPLPAVVGTRDQTGAWDAAGQTRTVLLSDGSHAQERLTAYNAGQHFAYTVTPQSGMLSVLAREARGKWWFIPGAKGGTEIVWTYDFSARSLWSWSLLLVVSLLWEYYMRHALRLLVGQLERAPK